MCRCLASAVASGKPLVLASPQVVLLQAVMLLQQAHCR
jgi:hypothetical protein